jgi:hypothetical protein
VVSKNPPGYDFRPIDSGLAGLDDAGMDADLVAAWKLCSSWPLRRRLRMRTAVVLYLMGFRRLAVRLIHDWL